jgi:nucleotide sugar dehydrogenase
MKNSLSGLRERIKQKKIKIAVVGLGYVGLPLAIEFAKRGLFVFGIEIDHDRLAHIRRKETYITDVTSAQLREALDSGRFSAAGDFRPVREAQVVIICVPTPLKRKYHPNISYIKQAVKAIAKNMQKATLVILESTTYPGTTDEVILPLLETGGRRHGEDFYLAFSPERIDPNNQAFPVHKIPKVVGGINRQATELAAAVYANIIEKVIPVSSSRVAEAAKLLENTFRLINIGMIDELAMMCHKMNIDIWEVIAAASTKPFGFMTFYPGPGVGGHCLDKGETLCVKDKDSLKVMEMPEFIRYLGSSKNGRVEVLSFDPLKRKSVFRQVTAASVRPYRGQMVTISTEGGRRIKVTDLHPMFVYNNNKWRLKYARDLEKGDSLPVSLGLPQLGQENIRSEVDLIAELRRRNSRLIEKIRVVPRDFYWSDYRREIGLVLRQSNKGKMPNAFWDYLSDNYLPLKYFYVLESLAPIDHGSLKLASGRGPSHSDIPAKILLDEEFCRLIGYYLSEGCYTKDKSARIRFSFNRSEREYIHDVLVILERLGVRASIYESKTWHTSCIKVPSNLFGFLLSDVLGCGKDCYEMNIPPRVFGFDDSRKKALISGLFRGDACVEHFFGKWHYRKNEKEYLHNVNTAHISFFTSSKRLFQQLVVLLHDLGIVPTFKKRKYLLTIFGYKQLSFFRSIFDGKKKLIVEKYLELNKNKPRNKTFVKRGGFATVKVRDISYSKGGLVYSLETEKPHSFVTSFGVAVHNCIPKDPLYLYWKARHHGFKSRFIKLASDVINYMPEYVAERVITLVKRKAQSEKRKMKILVIGVTYKKDVMDLRKAPPIDIIDVLQKKGIDVFYHDPLIPYLKINHIDLRSARLGREELRKFDCVIIATDHSSLDYAFILRNARLIFDTRNVYKGVEDKKIIKL